MKRLIDHIFSSIPYDPFKTGRRPLPWDRLVQPNKSIKEGNEKYLARIETGLLVVAMTGIGAGSIVSRFVLEDAVSSHILFVMWIILLVAYIVSRSQFYRLATPLQLLAYILWPVMSIGLGFNFDSERLLSILIFNIFTIFIGSVLLPFFATLLLSIGDIISIVLIPVVFANVPFESIIYPLVFNVVGTALILTLTLYRNALEIRRLAEISDANAQLKTELEERTKLEKKMEHSATHDALTGLPNRVLFFDRLSRSIERTKRHDDYSYAVIFLDLDRFKVVNDGLGHNIGDLLLVECASRLSACLRSSDTVARLGGDEFIILLEDVNDAGDYKQILERIQHDLSQPYNLNGSRVFTSASMGIVISSNDYQDSEEILRNADIAMYHAKAQGRNRFEMFDGEMLKRVWTGMEMETDLRQAIEQQEIKVYYQPIFDSETHHIIGFEALARWLHPERGLILPGDFIPTAEETGLIIPIGYLVLDQACQQIKAWQEQFSANPPLIVSVNVSSRQCAQKDFPHNVAKILLQYSLAASSLKLELTESMVVEDSISTSVMLNELRAIGVQVLIDDFGTGYSSLGYLHHLPIDTLKIDRSFVSRLENNGEGLEIVQTIVRLAHSLGMKVVAEGVETDKQLSLLKSLNCEYMQGFLFSKPVVGQEMEGFLGKFLG